MIKSSAFKVIASPLRLSNKHSFRNANLNSNVNLIKVSKNFTTQDIIRYVIYLSKEKEPFYIVNLHNLISQYERWTKNLQNIIPYYAIKANPNIEIIDTLHLLGAGFDCASMKEIQDTLLITGNPKKIIFAHPFKVPHHLEYAKAIGVNLVTADTLSELKKIYDFHRNAEILIRLKTDDSRSLVKLSSKFGATLSEAIAMLEYAHKLNLTIAGTSFHVGSECQSAESYSEAIKDCTEIFTRGISLGLDLKILDIGGGFPGPIKETNGDGFENMAVVIKQSITNHFQHLKKLEVIAEPGQYFAASAFTLVTTVIGKKTCIHKNKKAFKYYLDEGVFSSFADILYYKNIPNLKVLNSSSSQETYPSMVFGPTCDCRDRIGEFMFPELFLGDRLYVEKFGAYNEVLKSDYNGFSNTKKYIVFQE